jgi:hypothetical protein
MCPTCNARKRAKALPQITGQISPNNTDKRIRKGKKKRRENMEAAMGDGVEEEGRSKRNQKRIEEDVVPDEQQERSSEGNQHHDPQVSKKSPNFSLHLSHEQIREEFPSCTKRDRLTSAVLLGNYIKFVINYIVITVQVARK